MTQNDIDFAKWNCQIAILKAIHDFEKETGLKLVNLRYWEQPLPGGFLIKRNIDFDIWEK